MRKIVQAVFIGLLFTASHAYSDYSGDLEGASRAAMMGALGDAAQSQILQQNAEQEQNPDQAAMEQALAKELQDQAVRNMEAAKANTSGKTQVTSASPGGDANLALHDGGPVPGGGSPGGGVGGGGGGGGAEKGSPANPMGAENLPADVVDLSKVGAAKGADPPMSAGKGSGAMPNADNELPQIGSEKGAKMNDGEGFEGQRVPAPSKDGTGPANPGTGKGAGSAPDSGTGDWFSNSLNAIQNWFNTPGPQSPADIEHAMGAESMLHPEQFAKSFPGTQPWDVKSPNGSATFAWNPTDKTLPNIVNPQTGDAYSFNQIVSDSSGQKYAVYSTTDGSKQASVPVTTGTDGYNYVADNPSVQWSAPAGAQPLQTTVASRSMGMGGGMGGSTGRRRIFPH